MSPSEIDRLIHEPARLMIMAHLYTTRAADFIFLMRQTGLTWGNLSAHISKLESAGYVRVEKEFQGRKPHTKLQLSDAGRTAFCSYRQRMQMMLSALPK
ncbi:MAG: helix-turn-helix domain-containing protein [Chloroflexi bacterium]|nr:helix-turn-helix domain-containing protein [Chloroflexota bacterium]